MINARVRTALTRLDPRERFIIEQRVMNERPMTLKELGEHFERCFELFGHRDCGGRRLQSLGLETVASARDDGDRFRLFADEHDHAERGVRVAQQADNGQRPFHACGVQAPDSSRLHR